MRKRAMRKTLSKNKHQKAAHRPGEEKVSRAEIDDLLTMSCSVDVEERLLAAKYLCPCHIQARIPAVWEAIFRMMADPEPKVRYAAWHTWEDGGLPNDPAAFETLEQIYHQERDPKVRKFAEFIMGKALAERREREHVELWLAAKSPTKIRGKCDFCGESDVLVVQDLNTTLTSNGSLRAALICTHCIENSSETP